MNQIVLSGLKVSKIVEQHAPGGCRVNADSSGIRIRPAAHPTKAEEALYSAIRRANLVPEAVPIIITGMDAL